MDSQLGRVARFAAGALISISALAGASSPAEARHYRHAHHYGHYAHYARHGHVAHHGRRSVAAISSSPAFSAIVVDANSGRTLFSVAEDGLRHPASITKVMTLYLLFEQLDKGAMTLQTQIPVSEHAAAQEPSKLGVDPGDTISVENAIKAVVTRSANDVAVAIAEAIGRDESTFADMMTRKAHALGMSNTVYRNASGLPNDDQVTTARDLTILARSLEERFPRYFKYFSTHEFEYAGEVIGNHNHLLGRVDGVDGIKTGYTRASGFNLLTSVHRDGRSLIAVVMGGRTAGARDRVMENLIDDHIAEASTAHTATMVADASSEEPAPRAADPEPRGAHSVVVAANVPARAPSGRSVQSQLAEGDDADEGGAPTLHVAALAPRATARPQDQPVAGRPAQGPMTVVTTRPEQNPSPVELGRATGADAADAREPATAKSDIGVAQATVSAPVHLAWTKGPDPVAKRRDVVVASIGAPIPPAKPKLAESAARPTAKAPAETAVAKQMPARSDDEAASTHNGWAIQIGATDDAAKASALLTKARARNPSALAAAKPVTEKVRKGEDTFYRARFAGLDPATAESACRSLKRNGFSCFAARD
jgi:D-alanyl-D-alanine carboxypeptidase